MNFHDHIWALRRHLGHMTYMLDSDWLKNFLLRSDWLGPIVALIITTELSFLHWLHDLAQRLFWFPGSEFRFLHHRETEQA